MMAVVLAFLRGITPRGWIAIALLIAFLFVGGYCAHKGAQGQRDLQAAALAKTEVKASGARETAAGEGAIDATTIHSNLSERNHAAEAYPDSLPDDRELRRRCRQLRDAGRSLPACAGLGG